MVYNTIKKSKPVIYTTTWVNLSIIMLSERSQKKDSTYCTIPFIQNCTKCKQTGSGYLGMRGRERQFDLGLKIVWK